MDHGTVVEDDMQLVLQLKESGVKKRVNVAVKRGATY